MKWGIYLFILAGCLLVSCSEEDDKVIDIFKGKDNYIFSFTLEVDGKEYDARITDSIIAISLPFGTPIEEARVKYSISENALIEPDPEIIEDWSEPYEFIVTSHSGLKNSYYYVCSREEKAYKGNLFLQSQNDVNKFQESRTSVIDGSLIIGGSKDNPVWDLSGLCNLKKVKDAIQFKAPQHIANLNGLASLEEVGTLIIENISSSEIILPSLTTVSHDISLGGKDIIFYNLPKLREVKHDLTIFGDNTPDCQVELPHLESCGNFNLGGIEGEVNVSRLKQCHTLFIQMNAEFDHLLKAEVIWINGRDVRVGFPSLEECSTIRLEHAGECDFPALKRIRKECRHQVCVKSSRFPVLETVGVNFDASAPQLQKVGGRLYCTDSSLRLLPKLAETGSLDLELSDSADLSRLVIQDSLILHLTGSEKSILCGPEKCNYNLLIEQDQEFPKDFTLKGFHTIGSFGLDFRADASGQGISFAGIKEITGDCHCSVHRTGLSVKFPDLQKIGGSLYTDSPDIRFPGLPAGGTESQPSGKISGQP